MDIRTKLILALVSTSLLSMAVFGLAVYQFSGPLILQNASQELVDQLGTQLIDTGLSVAAFAILVGVVLGILGARQIRRLANTVDRIRHGELDLRAEVVGEDEVALLAQSLNEFMAQLNRSGDIFQLGSLRVLVAENHPGNRQLLDELLTNWRMQAVLVDDNISALEAIQAAQDNKEPIQLIVLALDAVETQEFEILHKLSALNNWDRCPIILLAENPGGLDEQKLRQMGVGHILAAPVIASDLMEAILEEMGVSAAALQDMPDLLLPQTEQRRILLAEDSAMIAKVTIGFLENWGHAVTLASDGQSAVEIAATEQFDLVLMDLEMPNMGGLAATLAIRETESESRQRLPIVALTARATKTDREECMAAGMDEYISKPVDPRVLYRLVCSFPQSGGGSERVVDWAVAERLTGGDEALLDELVELFPAEARKNLSAIAQGVDVNDAELVTRAAHSVKSAAGFFGANEVVDQALLIEKLGRQGGIEQARKALPELKKHTEQLIDALASPRSSQRGQAQSTTEQR